MHGKNGYFLKNNFDRKIENTIMYLKLAIPSCILVENRNQIKLYCETYQIIIDLKIIFENFRILELLELFRETETIIICWNRIVSNNNSRYVETMRIAFDWWRNVNPNRVYILPLCPYCSIGSPLIVSKSMHIVSL